MIVDPAMTDHGHSIAAAELKTVTKRAPTPKEIDDLLFAWTVVKHVKSNAIVYAKSLATVGIGAGQMEHMAQTFSFVGVAGNQCSFETQRVFVNNSGAQVAVRETAIYMTVYYPTTAAYIMAARDLISEDVPDGGAVTVTYTIRIVA